MHLKRRRLNTLSSSLLEKQPKKSTSQNSQMKDVFQISKYSDETFLGYFFNTVTFTRVSNNPLQNVLLGNA